MKVKALELLFADFKEATLQHRYITNGHIEPVLKKLAGSLKVETIGSSVLNNPIYGIQIGKGSKKILMWSQMHGNESTTTKAVFDLLNTLISGNQSVDHILSTCTIYIIPILNPDGAKAYTRVNANNVDLNRDAQARTQPESKVLRKIFKDFSPDFCYNLHGQRTIFSAGNTNKPATVSFLAPAQDENCTVTPTRKIAMEIIAKMNEVLQDIIPNQVGVYDDAFNLNCVGDTFQSENVPTMLFEAGHFKDDYGREHTRKYIYMSLLESLDYISRTNVDGNGFESYFIIPENEKYFLDVIIRNVKTTKDSESVDVGVLYQERLKDNKVVFVPKIEKMENLDTYFGHREYHFKGEVILDSKFMPLKIESENDFVVVNNEKISLLLK
ncbi:DUF2817 domain-containing protein [Flavobacteriaceae bacterium XHP0103]|uniref:M14 family metallopeptidase n=1 Tax=Marixanthotalea marina TaxID=2844359 RepID=UPI002989C67E|nr:M14 family metallopeptidase [Marixanthotalea marina]MBU3822310.1 DUF2817 domain-containing protein [Marixanthotalea marina]